MNKKIIGNRIKNLRTEQDLSQERVCAGIYLLSGQNVSKGQLSNWESGRHAPSLLCAVALSRFLGVSLDYLTGSTDIKEPPVESGVDLSDESARLVALRLLDPRLTNALKMYFDLSSGQKQQVLDMIEFLHEKQRGGNNQAAPS